MAAAGLDLTTLSDTAKVVAGAQFGSISPGRGSVTYQLEKSRPSDRMQSGLDELVAKGLMTVEPFSDLGGLIYRPLLSFRPALAWMMLPEIAPRLQEGGDLHFATTTPLTPDEAEALMSPFGQGLYAVERHQRTLADNPFTKNTHDWMEWRRGARAARRARR